MSAATCRAVDMTGISLRCACGETFELSAPELREYPGPRAREDLLLDRFNSHKQKREKTMTKKLTAVAVLLLGLAANARAQEWRGGLDRIYRGERPVLLAQAPPAAPQAQAQAAQAAIQANAPATSAACHTAVCFVWNDWKHAQVSAQLLYAPRRSFAFDGGSVDLAVAYNPAIGSSWWPTSFTAAGVPPPACAFLELGGGGDSSSAFLHVGSSCNVAPVLVGYAAKALTTAGGNYAVLGNLLLAPDGSGLKVSGGVKFNFLEAGGLETLRQISGEVVVGLGYVYKFKT